MNIISRLFRKRKKFRALGIVKIGYKELKPLADAVVRIAAQGTDIPWGHTEVFYMDKIYPIGLLKEEV